MFQPISTFKMITMFVIIMDFLLKLFYPNNFLVITFFHMLSYFITNKIQVHHFSKYFLLLQNNPFQYVQKLNYLMPIQITFFQDFFNNFLNPKIIYHCILQKRFRQIFLYFQRLLICQLNS